MIPPFKWNKKRERAAGYLAADDLSDEKIAAKLKVSRRTLADWKLHPDFQERIKGIVEATREAILQKGIADRVKRVEGLDDRKNGMLAVIKARAAEHSRIAATHRKAEKLAKTDPDGAAKLIRGLPGIGAGGETGLVVRQIKIASGVIVEEFAVDVGLLKEIRATDEQAARELGQWSERTTITADSPIALIEVVREKPKGDEA